ncbi:DUF4184 family protein [Streptomyces sp. SL13]|uniref:DUF4184 family protein n=1 Tax=Streptantibioticus silvisoli TaxID=2705255 RepID=A0AA90GZ83_9ACTN|nr:DUF4184 family protein [Streptantibioticus silvisoli]MDI5970314.1 DUF4184 family protein [Streptantibioticus silvisoli]
MPFTPSHVAAVLPALRGSGSGGVRGRGPLVAAALVAGSLAPDVPFFADSVLPGCHRLGRVTHGTAGVLVVDPLLAVALTVGWAAVRRPVIGLLPAATAGRVTRAFGGPPHHVPHRDVYGLAWFWASAALGAGTHVVWDAFTHGGRWGVRRFPVLDHEVAGVPLHHWAQYASSAAGLALVATWTSRTLHDADENLTEREERGVRRTRARLRPEVGRAAGKGPVVEEPAEGLVAEGLAEARRTAAEWATGRATEPGQATERERAAEPERATEPARWRGQGQGQATIGSSDQRPSVSVVLTSRQRTAGITLLAGCALAGAVARCRRDRPAGLSGLIASVSFGAGGWLPAGAAALALATRRRTAAG